MCYIVEFEQLVRGFEHHKFVPPSEIKAFLGEPIMPSRILKVDTKLGWEVSLKLRPLYPRGRGPKLQLGRR